MRPERRCEDVGSPCDLGLGQPSPVFAPGAVDAGRRESGRMDASRYASVLRILRERPRPLSYRIRAPKI